MPSRRVGGAVLSMTLAAGLLTVVSPIGPAQGADPASGPGYVAPVADAGDDQSVREGGVVTLDATRSTSSNLVTHAYTTTADFAQGTSINLADVPPDQLQLDDTTQPFEFIWIAASRRGTVIKIDTKTGKVVGEYWSAPQNRAKDPSRTTVDNNGNVWVGNRQETSSVGGQARGSVSQIGLVENGQCVDRNGNGKIDTSTGLGDIKPWPNSSGVDTDGGVETAVDECLVNYVRTKGVAIRQVSVDAENHVWVGGAAQGGSPSFFERLAPDGTAVRSINMRASADTGESGVVGCCYGGLIDKAGILWSSSGQNHLLRIDPSMPNGHADLVRVIPLGRTSYGLGIDPDGVLWQTNWTYNTVQKISPAGAILGTFNTGGPSNDRGIAVTPDGDVWVANSGNSSVSRLRNNGTFVAEIGVGRQPTGVAVDAAGKVWASNLSSNTASRINPATNSVDLTVSLGAGAEPYNYSDMTGATLTGAPDAGTWTTVYDSGAADTRWAYADWSATLPGDSAVEVFVASSADGVTFGPEVRLVDGLAPEGLADGQYLQVTVRFARSSAGESPSLQDLTLAHVGERASTLSYQWRPVAAAGPPVFLTSPTSAQPSFVAPDDGKYTFEVTVTDSAGQTDTDRVTVTVTNADPEMQVTAGPASERGVTLVHGKFTDPGWVDTHTATFDWGDGSSPDRAPVSTQGPGWGTFLGSHVYSSAGSYQVKVTLRDDDGGEVAQVVDQLRVEKPVAVWANSASLTDSLSWSGSEGSIEGRVHTNGQLRFIGATKTVTGATTYAGSISADTTKNSFDPAPVTAPVQDFPVTYEIADYRPDGPVAREIGANYHDMTSACSSGTWHEVSAPLPSGVYYADCPIMLNGSDIGGYVTLVSESTIKIAGSRPAFEPYLDGLLALSGASGSKAIEIATSTSKFLGVLFAGSGQISISGSKNRFFCGVLGDRVEITGGDTRIRGAACGRPDSTVSGPVVVPDLAASLTVDKAEALPSQTLGYDLTVTNRGSTLIAPAVIGLENVDTLTETVTGYDFALERLDLASGEWVPLAAKGDDGLRIELHSNAFPGVTYPENGGIAGTTVAPSGWATWGLEAVLWLDPARTKALLDPEVTGGIRTRVEFELTPSGAQARRLFTHGDNFIDALRAQSADVTDATATLLLPSGEANSIGPDAEPGFAGLTPGSSVTVHSSWAVPVAAARAAGESDAGYLARLRGLDGSNLTGGAFVVATGGVGRLVAPLSTVSTTRTLPVVKPTTTGPATIPAGATSDYELKLANVGSRQAEDVELVATASGETLTVAGAPTALAVGELTTATTQVTIAKENPPADVDVTGVVTWADAAGNSYGPIASTYSSGVLQPALLTATLADTLQTDVNGDGQVSPGDTLRYTLTATNHGGQSIDDVTATVTPDPESALAVGSVETSAGTVSSGNTPGDTSVDVNLGALQGQSTAQVNFDVVVRDPFPTGTTALQVQGLVTATGHDPVVTDDPARPGLTDPTRTAVVAPVPNLGAYLSVRHHLDADGNGKPSPGDTLRYQLEVHSIGSEAVTDIGVNVPIPAAATLNTDSLTATQGSTSHTGDSLTATLGTLHPFTSATVRFDLRIVDPVPSGTTAVAVQGTVSSTELADQLTDDPDTFVSGDPTQTSVTETVEPGEGDGDTTSGNGPTVTGFAPAEGAVVTAPTPVALGSVTPVEGTTVEGWKLTLREQGASADTAQILASGTGAPPTQETMTMTAAMSASAASGTEALATLDPTTMPNGIWVLQLVLVDSAGGRTSTGVAVVVDGQLKLGDAEVSYLDMAIPVGGIPIQLQRRYRSIDRRRDGDLGHGWSLDAANFRVQVNRPLGAGGWEQYGCGSGLIFVPLCYRTSKPHFVTVTWPNGRTETFDFTPGPGNTFFSMAVPTAYTGRRGTTSKLEPGPDDLGASWLGDGNLYGGAFGGDGIYDPQQFVLVAPDGTRYLLDRSSGLVQAADRTGNTVTVTEDGISSSAGPSVSYHRNPEGRIDRIDGPAGLTVSYDYDANGDLVSVTDGNGHVHRYGYQDHLLTTSDEPGAGPFQTLTYENGRLVSVDDGVNPPQTFDVDLGARTETTVSPDLKETVVTTFDERGNPVEVDRVFDGEHHKTTFEYNDFDFVTLRQDPTGRTWRAEYDDQGHLAWLQDARGKTTAFGEYTDFGVPRAIKDELGHTTRLTFDPETADLLSIRDPLGHSRSWTYNPDGTVATYHDGSLKPDGTPHEWSYTYEGGQVATEKDPGNNVTTYEHNAAGQLKAEIDATGVRTEYEYDGVGNLRFVRLPLGRTTEYRYDERDRLTDIFDGERRNTHYRYNDVGLLWKEERGNPANGERDTLTYTYTPRDQVATILNSAGDLLTYGYDGGGRLISVEDGEHQVTEYGYDLADRVVSTQYPNGSTDTWGYDENGRLDSVTDALGGETVIGRDDSGRVTSVSDPMQHMTIYEYDEAGRLRFVTDPLNHVTEYRYDQAGRLTAEINPLEESTEYAYGPAGRLSSIKDGEGRQTHYGYDDAGRPNRVTDALNRTASTSYDDGGWPKVHTMATGVSSTLVWDQAGLLKSVTDELNHTTTWNYDSVGRLEQRINGRGFATTWKYDPAGRVEREIDARGGTVEFGYDHAGQLTSITNPNSKVSLIGYDPLGNIDEFSNPLGKTWSWTYDPLGRLDISTDPKNQQVDWDYDGASRPDKAKTPDGVIDYTYDDADRLTSVADPTGTVSWAYDDADRPKLVTAPAGAVGYEYDHSGLLTAMQLPQGTVTRSYDPTGGLDKVTDWTGAWTDYDVNGAGQPDRLTRSNGVSTDYGYDDAGRLDHLSHTGVAGLIEEFGYDLDENGNRVGESSATGSATYTLDELDRLTKAVYPSGKTVDYTYYADGSRKTRTVGQKTTEYTYDNAGQLVTAVGPDRTIEYGYDANGNLETAGSDSYGYDWANRMVSASLDGVDHSWVYDGQGMRVGADGVSQLWDRTIDNPAGVEYLVGAGDTAFVQNPFGGLSTSIESGSTTWALGDALGSTRALTDGTGAVTGTTSYDAFGAVQAATGTQSAFGFAGEQADPGGLLYLRARTLNTDTGQFMQPDTVVQGAPGTIGFNRYVYAGANPTTWLDPTGNVTAIEYRGLLSGVSARLALASRVLGQCAYGALTESAMGLAISAIAGGVTVGGVAYDAITGCFSRGAKTVPRVPAPKQPPGSNATNGVPEIKAGVGGGESAGKAFPQSVKNSAVDENLAVTGGDVPVCVWCHMDTPKPHIDHAIPRSLGGDATLPNAQVACPHCNMSRGNGPHPVTPPEGYLGPWPPPWWPRP